MTGVLLSLDVVSLFINIPLDLIINSVSKRLDNILDNCKLYLTMNFSIKNDLGIYLFLLQ